MSNTPANGFLPYGRQCIEDDDIQAVAESLRGEYLTTGPRVADLENLICERTGARHAVMCSNGTAALHLAAIAAGLGEGDIAIVPTITFLATANAARYCGADVVFADVSPETGLMTADTLDQAIKRSPKKAKAVFPVHLTGQCVDLQSIKAVADRHGLKIIADSCHALGSEYKVNDSWHQAGSCALEDISVFSFHPVKTIAMGEGGAVTTNNCEIDKRLRRLRHHGMIMRPDVAPWYYEMPELGYNYREPDILCALGVSQMKKLGRFLEKRRALVSLYDKKLKEFSPYIMPPEKVSEGRVGWHLYAARIDFEKIGKSRKNCMNFLKNSGIGTQVHYIPVHQQPYYKSLYGGLSLPGAQHYYERTLSLPLFPTMTEADVNYVVERLSDLLPQ